MADHAASIARSLAAHARTELARAIWQADLDWLNEHHPCRCCCSEHTFAPHCPAFVWGACRGQDESPIDDDAWASHYAAFHGMSREKFFGWEITLT